MPPGNVTVYETLSVWAGPWSCGYAAHGYTCRGERELEAWMEVSLVSLRQGASCRSGLTILDETSGQYPEPILFAYRLMEKQVASTTTLPPDVTSRRQKMMSCSDAGEAIELRR